MGELTEQIMSGGPRLIPLSELPQVAALMAAKRVRWEIYRMIDLVEAALADRPLPSAALMAYAELWALCHPPSRSYGPLTETEARHIVAALRGEWTPDVYCSAFRAAVTAHLDDIPPHEGEYRAASLALRACWGHRRE